METTTTTTATEKLNKTNYIKSYPIFKKLPLSNTQLNLIELVLSYQIANKQCYLNRKDIADYLNLKNAKTADNLILILKKAGYISTNQKHNLKINSGIMSGGSSSTITVNLQFIFDILENKTTNEIASVIAPIETVIEVIQEEETIAVIAPIETVIEDVQQEEIVAVIAPIEVYKEEEHPVVDWMAFLPSKNEEIKVAKKLTMDYALPILSSVIFKNNIAAYNKELVVSKIKKEIINNSITVDEFNDDFVLKLINQSA